MLRKMKIALYALSLTLTTLAAARAGDYNANPAQGVRLTTTLTGPAIGGVKPSGNADFRDDGTRRGLKVQVESVNLPDSTVLTVAVVHNGSAVKAGTITLLAGFGELDLRTQDGEVVPQVQQGDVVVVLQGRTRRLAGVF